jgi:exosortase D (VPLPA-CTERM-specific)
MTLTTLAARLRFSPAAYALMFAAAAAVALPFSSALSQLYSSWSIEPEYSHGVLIPLISLFLLWREREWLRRTELTGSWLGLPVIAAGLALWFVGELATIYTIVQYGFLVALYGLVLSMTGVAVFARLWMPLLILVLMVPLPPFLAGSLSLQLQLISSALGVWFIRLAGVSVLLQGNVIDLGAYQLQVAEACDGLRYLFPLMTLAFVVAYFFRAPLWKRALLFATSVPIAIVMNSIRIGVIGVTVDRWGPKMAEGLLHDFEGWVVFMMSTAVLIVVAIALARTDRNVKHWREAFTWSAPATAPSATTDPIVRRRVPRTFVAATGLVAAASVAAFAMPQRQEVKPARTDFLELPTQLGEWSGRRQPLESVYLDALKLDDYVLADFQRPGRLPVNLYAAYYGSQRKGQAVHSPRSCIPGGGWRIRSIEQRTLRDVGAPGQTLPVNRVEIELGSQRQVVYYWFDQRGRTITNEYLVKWYILWDAITRNRTDGALVRLTAPAPHGSAGDPDAEILAFARQVMPRLARHIPH